MRTFLDRAGIRCSDTEAIASGLIAAGLVVAVILVLLKGGA